MLGRLDLANNAGLRLPILGFYTACVSRRSNGIMLSASSCVASKSTGHAEPAFTAASHVRAQTHHESPGFKPGNEKCGAGVIKSLPCDFANSRNSCVTTQHTVCDPRSFSSVLQQPSRYQPVRGSVEHDLSSVPNTLIEGCMVLACIPPLSIIVWKQRFSFKIRVLNIVGGERFLMEKRKRGSDATRYSPKFAPF